MIQSTIQRILELLVVVVVVVVALIQIRQRPKAGIAVAAAIQGIVSSEISKVRTNEGSDSGKAWWWTSNINSLIFGSIRWIVPIRALPYDHSIVTTVVCVTLTSHVGLLQSSHRGHSPGKFSSWLFMHVRHRHTCSIGTCTYSFGLLLPALTDESHRHTNVNRTCSTCTTKKLRKVTRIERKYVSPGAHSIIGQMDSIHYVPVPMYAIRSMSSKISQRQVSCNHESNSTFLYRGCCCDCFFEFCWITHKLLLGCLLG
jgi:hypothetical protein